MQLGIFAKTFPGTDPLSVLSAVRDSGYAATQFNLACCGLPSMPDAVPGSVIKAIEAAAETTGISLVALSGTYNMAHPDISVRQAGLRQLAVVIETAAALSIPLVTLCTGTRNPQDQWAHHPDNTDPSAWADMATEMAKALALAEKHGVDLGIEPEQANIVTSAEDAKRLIVEMGSKRLRIVLDPANLSKAPHRRKPEISSSVRLKPPPGISPWPMPRIAMPMGVWQLPARASWIFPISSHD